MEITEGETGREGGVVNGGLGGGWGGAKRAATVGDRCAVLGVRR